MESIRTPFANIIRHTGLLALAVLLCTSNDSFAQVRNKKPDRGVYRPPAIESVAGDEEAEPLSKLIRAGSGVQLNEAPNRKRDQQRSANSKGAKWGAPLVDTDLTDARAVKTTTKAQAAKPRLVQGRPKLRDVAPEQIEPLSDPAEVLRTDPIQLAPPHRPQRVGKDVVITGGETWVDEGEVYYEPDSYAPVLNPSCGGCNGCDGCVSCDSGCDSIASHHLIDWCNAGNAYLSLAPDRWFASAELMLMFRKGDGLPPLVTTGDSTREVPNPNPNPSPLEPTTFTVSNEDQAGQIGRDDTRVLVGNENIFEDLTAGGRFTLGTWLDCQRCRSLQMRGWFAGEQRYRFSTNQDQFPVLARPFFNVSDGQDPESDALLIAFPEVEIDDQTNVGETIVIPARANGSVSVNGDSNVYGADISVRQLWYGKYGGTVDVLYGYQFMRMDENLAIGSTSLSLDEDFAPVGSVISVYDGFDVKNEFHGGQFGLASAYREGCWSFRGLFKLGFGALQRRAKLIGQTKTSIDGATAIDPNGLLVRSTNRGNYSDTEFAWSPELDLTLGWQHFPMFDVTCGYHIVALTDALQVSGTIDPNLAVNLSDPPLGQQRPVAAFRYDTYYVHGIHFGLQYIY